MCGNIHGHCHALIFAVITCYECDFSVYHASGCVRHIATPSLCRYRVQTILPWRDLRPWPEVSFPAAEQTCHDPLSFGERLPERMFLASLHASTAVPSMSALLRVPLAVVILTLYLIVFAPLRLCARFPGIVASGTRWRLTHASEFWVVQWCTCYLCARAGLTLPPVAIRCFHACRSAPAARLRGMGWFVVLCCVARCLVWCGGYVGGSCPSVYRTAP